MNCNSNRKAEKFNKNHEYRVANQKKKFVLKIVNSQNLNEKIKTPNFDKESITSKRVQKR